MAGAPIYLDYNATTPVDPRVLDEMYPYFSQKFGNASSSQHLYGWDAEEAVELARERVAALIGVSPAEIIFTSGATEAINLALFGSLNEGDHLITCRTEHKAVLDVCGVLEHKGIDVTCLGVDESGLIDPDDLEDAIRPNTRLICIMHSNNETGVIQPAEKIGRIAGDHEILFMTDATQSAGKIPVDLRSLSVDMAAFSGHKIYAPKGVGVLFIKGGLKPELKPLIFGGGHESGLRSGTLNVPGIVGLGKACQIITEDGSQEAEKIFALRDRLESELLKIGGTGINGTKESRLPNVLNLSFDGIDGTKLIRSLKGLAVSQGSACTSLIQEASHVLKAMGISDERAFASVRFSLGRYTTDEEIDRAIDIVRSAIEILKLQHR